ncbi:MAG: diaminopimelate decarboxylase [Methylococcales bacterium]
MDHFQYQNGQLCVEDVPLTEIAKRYGTPCYVYSRATLERHWHAFDRAFGEHQHLICYAVKANSNLAVLNVLARLGSGFDIASAGELARVLKAGGQPEKIVFSGVGKRDDELRFALEAGIHCFNIEVDEELERLNRMAVRSGRKARVSVRVNPDVDARTHPYIATGLKENKFGIDFRDAIRVYHHAAKLPALDVIGVDCHIGSQLTSVQPFIDALDRVLELAERLRNEGIEIRHLDLGGGLGIRYGNEEPPDPSFYVRALYERIGDLDYEILLEPGRAIAGNAGILLCRVEYLKSTHEKNFAIVDAAMNDLLRPALYGAWQEIVAVDKQSRALEREYDIVGPVCETGDFLGKARKLAVSVGDLLAVRSSGAYGFSMSSNYNSRPRAAEILVDRDRMHLVRERERIEQLWSGERLPDWSCN